MTYSSNFIENRAMQRINYRESSIELFDNNRKNNTTYQVIFDKNGFPVPDGKILTLKEDASFFLGAIKRKAEYTYTCSGNESIKDIKNKFHLKDGAIQSCNSYINDDEWVPEKGRKIYFYKEDVVTK